MGQTANHLEDVAILSANPFYHALALRLGALNNYHQGHFDRARMWALQATTAIENSLGECIHLYRCRMIVGMADDRMRRLPSTTIESRSPAAVATPRPKRQSTPAPDATAATLRRFKITLHRLRRILEPEAAQPPGSSVILLKDTLVSLDMARCQVDANEFLAACEQIIGGRYPGQMRHVQRSGLQRTAAGLRI